MNPTPPQSSIFHCTATPLTSLCKCIGSTPHSGQHTKGTTVTRGLCSSSKAHCSFRCPSPSLSLSLSLSPLRDGCRPALYTILHMSPLAPRAQAGVALAVVVFVWCVAQHNCAECAQQHNNTPPTIRQAVAFVIRHPEVYLFPTHTPLPPLRQVVVTYVHMRMYCMQPAKGPSLSLIRCIENQWFVCPFRLNPLLQNPCTFKTGAIKGCDRYPPLRRRVVAWCGRPACRVCGRI